MTRATSEVGSSGFKRDKKRFSDFIFERIDKPVGLSAKDIVGILDVFLKEKEENDELLAAPEVVRQVKTLRREFYLESKLKRKVL